MKIEISNRLTISNAPEWYEEELEDRLTFQNPKWTENEKHGRWNGKTPEFIECFERSGSGLTLPRGYAAKLIDRTRREGLTFTLEDRRRVLPEVDFDFGGELRPYQTEAVGKMLEKDFGTLAAPTGSGKTIMGLAIIAERKQPALVVVHTKELLGQWIDRIGTFLGIPADEIGVIGGGKRRIGEKVTVGLVQSVYKCAADVSSRVGHLVIDECHRAPSRTFTEAVSAFDSKYMLGLSATPWRRDKLSRLIFWHVGDVVHSIERDDLVETGDVLEADVILRETDFLPFSDPSLEYSKMLAELVEDGPRNDLISRDVSKEAARGQGVCLVLSDRKAHCEALQGFLKDLGVESELLTGDLGNRKRARVVEELNAGRIRVLVATGQLIGEGFDCKELSTLFLATPIRFDGRVLQYLGRVLRPAPGKQRARVFDYVDRKVGVLAAAARARQRVYTQARRAA